MNMTFEIDDEEVLVEKVKRHIMNNINFETSEFIAEQMKEYIHNFLKALIVESKQFDYCYPVYEGMLKIENDQTLANWIINNLEHLWT